MTKRLATPYEEHLVEITKRTKKCGPAAAATLIVCATKELMEMIISYLEIPELCSLASTNHSWHDLVTRQRVDEKAAPVNGCFRTASYRQVRHYNWFREIYRGISVRRLELRVPILLVPLVLQLPHLEMQIKVEDRSNTRFERLKFESFCRPSAIVEYLSILSDADKKFPVPPLPKVKILEAQLSAVQMAALIRECTSLSELSYCFRDQPAEEGPHHPIAPVLAELVRNGHPKRISRLEFLGCSEYKSRPINMAEWRSATFPVLKRFSVRDSRIPLPLVTTKLEELRYGPNQPFPRSRNAAVHTERLILEVTNCLRPVYVPAAGEISCERLSLHFGKLCARNGFMISMREARHRLGDVRRVEISDHLNEFKGEIAFLAGGETIETSGIVNPCALASYPLTRIRYLDYIPGVLQYGRLAGDVALNSREFKAYFIELLDLDLEVQEDPAEIGQVRLIALKSGPGPRYLGAAWDFIERQKRFFGQEVELYLGSSKLYP